MESRKIRVETGIEVNVNDAGECIVVRVDDQLFQQQFYGLIGKLEELSDDSKKPAEKEERLQVTIEKTRELMADIDKVFGANTCKKVFGNTVPSGYALADFFDQLIPIIQERNEIRNNRILERYNRNRKGAGR